MIYLSSHEICKKRKAKKEGYFILYKKTFPFISLFCFSFLKTKKVPCVHLGLEIEPPRLVIKLAPLGSLY
jgi:hypothetical protein